MSARLLELQRVLAASRQRLGALADRLARLKQPGQDRVPARGTSDVAGAPLPFGGAEARPIDDLELTFRAVDVDVSVDAGSDQDKAR